MRELFQNTLLCVQFVPLVAPEMFVFLQDFLREDIISHIFTECDSS